VELSLANKFRIAAVMALGVLVIGVLARPLANHSDPLAAVQVTNLTLAGIAALLLMAFCVGAAGYVISWPHGREIGILAAPTGIATWALRSGSMASLMQANPTFELRAALLSTIKWEGFVWLGVVAAGYAGVLMAQKLAAKPQPSKRSNPGPNAYINDAVAVAGSALVAYLLIGRLAQDVVIPNIGSGPAVSQAPVGQIAFAVLLAFGIAAFAVKSLLDVSYIWPSVASAFVTGLAVTLSLKHTVLEHFARNWPAVCFPTSAVAVLPVQMVSFGVLGSVAGYWLAVRYCHWCKHELQ